MPFSECPPGSEHGQMIKSESLFFSGGLLKNWLSEVVLEELKQIMAFYLLTFHHAVWGPDGCWSLTSSLPINTKTGNTSWYGCTSVSCRKQCPSHEPVGRRRQLQSQPHRRDGKCLMQLLFLLFSAGSTFCHMSRKIMSNLNFVSSGRTEEG